MTDRKAQHQARAQLVREGTRTLARATITDYRQAKPTHQPRPQSEATDRKVLWTRSEGSGDLTTTLVDLDELVDSIWGSEPEPVPAKPRTAADLLARLNARHKN
jgi:hypothetical protein